MTALATKLRTYLALGLDNIARVAFYRFRVKNGLFQPRPTKVLPLPAVFFSRSALAATPVAAPYSWQTQGVLFGHYPFPLGPDAPNWLANPITGSVFPESQRIWWEIGDFDPGFGDIKLVWELSRFEWAIAMAQRARNGDYDSLAKLNEWINDWCRHSPPYYGPNWKCGQEASIRVMHLAVAALILGQLETPQPALCILIEQHLERIWPTIGYATAQDNNHATSEAAALFIGGSLLVASGLASAQRYATVGRQKLEQAVVRLVSEDGSFSQYSLNYHRVFLDTVSMCELVRRTLSLAPFSSDYTKRILAAAEWLRHFIVTGNGDAPNLGANDGARLLPLADLPYRDFRPSCQIAFALFSDNEVFPESACHQPLSWLGVKTGVRILPDPQSRIFDQGGYAILRRGDVTAMLRFPRYRFRPSHCDAMHVDLWVGDQAWLRDGGTYSYNEGEEWLDYFAGDAAHNGIQFDGRPQMPRLGRFLLGDWLKSDITTSLLETADNTCFGASLTNHGRYSHERCLELYNDKLVVVDHVSGFLTEALMRWRLAPSNWEIQETGLICADMSIDIKSSDGVLKMELCDGYESRHYMEKTVLPVLHVTVSKASTITTEFRWRP